MSGLFVIEERDRHGVGLARSGLSKLEAERTRDVLARTFPSMRYTVEPQRMIGRGKNRRIAYPQWTEAAPVLLHEGFWW
jgi:hypothetical protein